MGGRDADLVGDTVSFSILSKCLASVSGEYLSFPPDTHLQENVARQQPHCFRPEAGHRAAMLCIFTQSFLNRGRKNKTKVRSPLCFSPKFLASVLESVTDLFAAQSGTGICEVWHFLLQNRCSHVVSFYLFILFISLSSLYLYIYMSLSLSLSLHIYI